VTAARDHSLLARVSGHSFGRDAAMTEYLQPDLSEPVNVVYDLITDWFPNAAEHEVGELAFAIVRDGLHLKHVAGELWAATLDRKL
jgi:hypothetical protein